MFEVNIKVEPQNSSDMQRALEFILDQPCMSKFKEIYDNKSSYLTGNLACNSRNNQELIDKIRLILYIGQAKVAVFTNLQLILTMVL